MDTEIDTTNTFCVSVRSNGDRIAFFPPNHPISPDEALVFAAWLVALAEPNASFKFDEALEAVQST